MWIKAIFCTEDIIYAERLARFFDKEYGNKIELNLCSSIKDFFEFVEQNTIDIALFGDEFEETVQGRIKDIPCVWALVRNQIYETDDNSELNQIDKFQKGDQIYKNIFELYSSGKKIKHIHVGTTESEIQKIYVFTSASGGSGTSTVAKAYARRCSSYEKVLYLDLGLFNCTEVIEGNANGMDEILLALKSRRNILPLKLVSAVSTTEEGIFTYGSCSDECNLLELGREDIQNLLKGISTLSEYKKVIIDIGSFISSKEIMFMKSADAIICIVEESDIGKRKYKRYCDFLENAGKREQIRLIKKMLIFRNKVKQDYDIDSDIFQGRIAGWAPYISTTSYDAVIKRIAQSDSFNNLEIDDE